MSNGKNKHPHRNNQTDARTENQIMKSKRSNGKSSGEKQEIKQGRQNTMQESKESNEQGNKNQSEQNIKSNNGEIEPTKKH